MLVSFIRLFKILCCIAQYRLLELLPNVPTIVHIAMLPFYILPRHKGTRGARLRLAFEELGPIYIKFGQLLSTRPDLLAPDLIDELTLLQDKVPPFSADEFKRIVEHALKESTDNLFASYESQALASASIAQVHAAVLKTGEAVVIKVVRPGIEKIIDQDTRLLARIAQFIERYVKEGPRLRPVEVVRDYRDTVFDELDLMREAANASQLRRNFADSNMLYIPEVYWDLCRHNVIVIERIYGIPVNNIAALHAQNTDMKLLAERGVEIFFTQVFEHNFFHADMHPGNVFVSRETPHSPSFIGIDTAIVGSLSRADQYYLARNLIAMFRRDYHQVAELHVLSGWVPENTSVAAFESAIRAVCEPIFQKPLKEISFGEALITLFRTAQRFNMPVQPQLVLLQKTLLNIEGLGRQIYPELDLWQTAHPFLERWLKKRYHPNSLWREFKYHAPEWAEKLPELPALFFDTLVEIKKNAHESRTKNTTEVERKPQSNSINTAMRGIAAAALLILAAAFAANYTIPDINPNLIAILLSLIALLLILKK